jgi:hypothetical protein
MAKRILRFSCTEVIMKRNATSLYLFILVLILSALSFAQEGKIYWGSEVPEGWNGNWPDELKTAAEKADFERTASNADILEFISTLKWKSENVHVFNMFVSDLRRNCPVVVLADPRLISPREAQESEKMVVYLQGGIHPGECEGKEALLMLMRDILFGEKKYLLDSLIILFCPNFNVDGGETLSVADGLPKLSGIRENALGYDVNRDAIKVETTNMQGAYRNVFNTWDPIIILDTHRMGGARHGYAIVHAASNVPTAHPGPRGYVTESIFPALQKGARENGGIEIHFHAGLDRSWPPTVFSHDNAIWSVEGKFMVSGYGLRNRMSILVETPGYTTFERKIYAQYVFASELLDYSAKYGKEMRDICRRADKETVNNVVQLAESGGLKNFVDGRYESYGKFDILVYETLESRIIPGTSVRERGLSVFNERPVLCSGVELVTKPVGTKQATVPRGYLLPSDLGFIVDKLHIHNIQVEVLDKPVTVSGEEFVIDKLESIRKGGYPMTQLHGGFFNSAEKEFPAGTYKVDLAQPLANMAFYCLEPEVGDGFAGWNMLNDYLKVLGVETHSVVYPIYKYLKIIE